MSEINQKIVDDDILHDRIMEPAREYLRAKELAGRDKNTFERFRLQADLTVMRRRFARLEEQLENVIAERDEARRDCCNFYSHRMFDLGKTDEPDYAKWWARLRQWDYLYEKTGGE